MCSLPPASKKKLIRKSSISKEPRINMESVDDSFDYYKTMYNDDLKGLDGDSGDDDKDKTDHCVPDERGQPVSERADRQASLHLLQKIDD